MNLSRILYPALLLLIALPVAAEDRPFIDEMHPDVNVPDQQPWKEGAINLPPFPQEGDLVEFEVDGAPGQFRYFIDGKNLAIGDDRVVRYTLVIRSDSGANNISFEGMRCDSWEHKVYAYDNGRGEFRRVASPEWERTPKHVQGPHYELHTFYLSIPYQYKPRSHKEIIRALRGKMDVQDAGFYAD